MILASSSRHHWSYFSLTDQLAVDPQSYQDFYQAEKNGLFAYLNNIINLLWASPNLFSRWVEGPVSSYGSGMSFQLLVWTQVTFLATFTAVSEENSTWNRPWYHLSSQRHLLWSLMSTQSPGFRLWSTDVAANGKALFTCECNADRVADRLAQYLNISSSHNVVVGRECLTVPIPVWGDLQNRISNGLRPCLFLSYLHAYVEKH